MPAPDFADAHPGYVSLSALRLLFLSGRQAIVAFVNKNSGAGAPRARFVMATANKSNPLLTDERSRRSPD